MTYDSCKKIYSIGLLSTTFLSSFALAKPQRQIVIRSIEQDGNTHLKVRASAFEVDENGIFPITTLDRQAFQLKFDGDQLTAQSVGLTLFDSSRRWNNRAVVWAYDATGVRTMKGLNKDLRTLTAQEFPNINADFMSILGVTTQKTIERVRLDPNQQDNTLVMQRKLLGEPSSNAQAKVFSDSPLCVAAKTFEQWTAAGLKNFDQKIFLLLGGASNETSEASRLSSDCLKKLSAMNVIIHQIIFAKPETFKQRHWTTNNDIISQGAVFRVVNLQGALRALQASKNLLDKEYLLRSELPNNLRLATEKRPTTIQLIGSYYGHKFASPPSPFVLNHQTKQHVVESKFAHSDAVISPPRSSKVAGKFTLTMNAWLEWIATAFLIGGVVTVRHMRRMGAIAFPPVEQRHDEVDGESPLLIVLNGKNKGHEYVLKQNTIVFGHGLGCDLRLRGPGVLRKHGCLKFQGDKALLEDFSDGELSVNGRPLQRLRIIGHGSVIQIGELQLLFRCGET